MKPTTIVEVMGRTEQGRTSPYLCRGDDGVEYFVKSGALPPYQRVAEWLGATLAQALRLPVAPFRLVCIPEELVAAKVPWLRELGAGIGFASEKQQAREFTMSDAERVDTTLAGRIAAFDWWIRNSDRNLSSRGGNANLLWRATAKPTGLVIIDHNLAFDPGFSAREFFDMHVFAPQFKALLGDFIEIERVRQAFCDVRASLTRFWSTIPESWRYSDPERTVAARWAASEFDRVLARCEAPDSFWTS